MLNRDFAEALLSCFLSASQVLEKQPVSLAAHVPMAMHESSHKCACCIMATNEEYATQSPAGVFILYLPHTRAQQGHG